MSVLAASRIRAWGLIVCLAAFAATAWGQAGSLGKFDLPFVPPKRRALIIGASEYKSLGRLDFAAKDAASIRTTLIDRFRFTKNDAILLSDGEGGSALPTAAEIRKQLALLLKDPSLNRGDLFLLYFSGHGIGTDSGDYLCPTDATLTDVETKGVPVKEIIASFVKAGLKNVLIIADACRSGKSNPFGRDLIDLGKKSNIGVILGCAPGQRSYEYPDLGSGAFTYFLNRTLKDVSVRSSYGGLWASKVGEAVSKRVKAYTEKDYGDSPQVPTTWGDGATDVLLGAFPTAETVSPELAKRQLEEFKEDAKQVGRDQFAASAVELALKLFESNRLEDVIELLKTVESTGNPTDTSRHLLATSLFIVGRHGEADRQFRAIVEESKNPYVVNLSIAQNPSRAIDRSRRKQAVYDLWAMDPSREIATVLWSTLRMYGTKADVAERFPPVLQTLSKEDRLYWIVKGDLEANADRYTESIDCYAKALEYPDPILIDNAVRITIYPVLKLYGTPKQKTDLFEAALKDPKTKGIWQSLIALDLQEAGQFDKAFEAAKEATEGTGLEGLDMIRIVKAAGPRCGELYEKLLEHSGRIPYDWRGRLAVAMAKSIKQGGQGIAQELENLDRYSDDDLSVIQEAYPLLESILNQSARQKLVTPEVVNDVVLIMYDDLLNRVDTFAGDSDLWWLFCTYAGRIENPYQALWHVKRKLLPAIEKNEISADAITAAFYVASCVGDLDLAKRLSHHPNLLEPDRSLIQWSQAANLIYQGKGQEARLLAKDLPTEGFGQTAIIESLRRYLVGPPMTVKEATSLPEEDLVQAAIKGIALSELKQWDLAEPLLAKSVFYRNWFYAPLHFKAVEIYVDRLRSTGRIDALNEAVFATTYGALGVTLTQNLAFGKTPSIKDFVGTRNLPAKWQGDEPLSQTDPSHLFDMDGRGAGTGNWKLIVQPDGSAKVILTIKNGATREFTGRVDAAGMLFATSGSGKDAYEMRAKLIPTALMGEAPFLNPGQAVVVINPRGQKILILAKPVK